MQPERVRTTLESKRAFADTSKQENRVFNRVLPDQSGSIGVQSQLDNSRPSETPAIKRKIYVKDRWQSPRVRSGDVLIEHVPRSMEADRIMVSGPESNATTASSPINFPHGMIAKTQSVVQYDQLKSKRIIEAYQIATQLLEEVAGKTATAYFTPYGDTHDHYVTPYGPPEVTLDTGFRTDEGKPGSDARGCQVTSNITAGTKEDCDVDDKNIERMSHTSSLDPEIDQAQIDRLLSLAGGRSLTDDDDTDDDVQVLASFTRAQPDIDVGVIVNRVLSTIASYGFAGTEEAIKLQDIIDPGSLVKNLIIPKDQSQATSRFYATLASRAQGSSRPGGQIPPSRSNDVGYISIPQTYDGVQGSDPFGRPTAFNAAIKPLYVDNCGRHIPNQAVNLSSGFDTHILNSQQGVLIPHRSNRYSGLIPTYHTAGPSPTPVVQNFPFVPCSMPPPPLPSRIGTARGKTVEEAKKVRDYGFPPLPSSRPGRRAESN